MEINEKEEKLRKRLEEIKKLEEEIKLREKTVKKKENEKKQVPLRLSPSLWQKVSVWADEDFRSINGQIEYILAKAVREHFKEK